MTTTQSTYLDAFFSAYLECALWSSVDTDEAGNGEPLDDNYSSDDISKETQDRMLADCEDFVHANAADLQTIAPEQAGHDFWLTRNRHGAGFWDRGLGDLGDRLTKASKVYGSFDLYVGDDGQIHGQ